jgi:hypothetical protein
MCASQWSVDQLVDVEPRTWEGINRPGGVAKITKVHYSNGFVESVDVKYIIGGGFDTKLDLDFCAIHQDLPSRGRARRERDLYKASAAKRGRSNENNDGPKPKKKKPKTPKNDENTYPINAVKTTSREKQQLEDSKTTKNKSDVVKFKVVLKHPRPCSNVLVPQDYECKVSPLAHTPVELRKTKPHKSSSKTSRPTTTESCSAKRAIVQTKSSAPAVGYTKSNNKKTPAPEAPSNRFPLKRVYDSQVDIANDFCHDIIGKPTSSPFVEEKKQPPTKTAVSLSPVNKTYVAVCYILCFVMANKLALSSYISLSLCI